MALASRAVGHLEHPSADSVHACARLGDIRVVNRGVYDYSGWYLGFGWNSPESVPSGSTRHLPRMCSTGIVSSGS